MRHQSLRTRLRPLMDGKPKKKPKSKGGPELQTTPKTYWLCRAMLAKMTTLPQDIQGLI